MLDLQAFILYNSTEFIGNEFGPFKRPYLRQLALHVGIPRGVHFAPQPHHYGRGAASI